MSEEVQTTLEVEAPALVQTPDNAAISDATTLPDVEKVGQAFTDAVDQGSPDVVTEPAKVDEASSPTECQDPPAGDKEPDTVEVAAPLVESTPVNEETTATPAVASDKTEEQATPAAEPVQSETVSQDPPAADAEPAKETAEEVAPTAESPTTEEKTEDPAPPTAETVKDEAVEPAVAPLAEAEAAEKNTEQAAPTEAEDKPEGQTPQEAEKSSSVDDEKKAAEP